MNHAQRIARIRLRMEAERVDALALSVGSDLPYLIGYDAMPLERLTMLVLPQHGDAKLVIPQLEVARVKSGFDQFEIVAWQETDDPIALVASMLPEHGRIAIGDHTWARFVLALQRLRPDITFVPASVVTAAVRMVKMPDEIEVLQRAASAVDAVVGEMRSQPFAGRSELDIHRELIERMLQHGHQRANFAIVAAGENAASPHHEPGTRIVADGDLVLCDLGGTFDGYCSDITRMFHVGAPPQEIADVYSVLFEAHAMGCAAGVVGAPCETVDAAARSVIERYGFGEYFVHRTGHGIGTEAHEEPYMVSGNRITIEAGHAFSVEPGIYIPGRFGMRLEDIVVATTDGPLLLNCAARDIAVVG